MSDNTRLFQEAAVEAVAEPGNTKSIATMMQLACEAPTAKRRQWAARWLLIHCGVRVVEEQVDHAAPATAEGFC